MDPVAILIMLVIGAVAGWLAGVVYSGAGFGLLGNIVVGILGAIIAISVHRMILLLDQVVTLGAQGRQDELVDDHFPGIIGHIISSAIGAVILLVLVSFVSRRAV